MPSSESFNGSKKLHVEAMDMVKAMRQNHALEHATITLLFVRLEGKIQIVGRTSLTGFYLYGDIPTDAVEEAVSKALRRLQEGEGSLAVSPMCGTNLVVAGLAAGIASTIAGKGHRGLSKFNRIIQASIAAMLISQPLGRFAQKHLTTTTDLDNVSIAQITKKGKGKRTRHKIELIHT